jgi:hypothetical protein
MSCPWMPTGSPATHSAREHGFRILSGWTAVPRHDAINILMYFVTVILLLFVFPLASVTVEAARSPHTVSLIILTGRWFAFWAVGVRLFIAGARQVIQPQFTAQEIFHIQERESFAIVREVGFANLSMGLLGICSVFRAGWIVPAALVGGLYYGLAGIGHVFQPERNAKEYMAMISDFFAFLVLTVFVVRSLT